MFVTLSLPVATDKCMCSSGDAALEGSGVSSQEMPPLSLFTGPLR